MEYVDSDLAERQFQFLTTLESAVQLSAALSSHLLSCHQLAGQILTHSLTPPSSVFEFEQQAMRGDNMEEEKVIEMMRNVAKMATEGDKRVRTPSLEDH